MDPYRLQTPTRLQANGPIITGAQQRRVEGRTREQRDKRTARDEIDGNVARMGELEKCMTSRRKELRQNEWIILKMYLKGAEFEEVGSIHLAWERDQ
jgi:hypothetical protein